ncbi:TPA: toll/interleukin-1 receptor domain-containing protein [Elizabethkingia anophelis]
MGFITESTLKSYTKSNKYPSYKSSSQIISEERVKYKSLSATKVFLSHKHDEIEHLESTISLLKNEGVDVYIDWMDDGMPKSTSGETAVRIKEKIKENDKFILLATEGAINSKWCNWELGLGDAAKYINNIAILPVIKYSTSEFAGSEYLQIYPYIYFIDYRQYFNGEYRDNGVYVVYPKINGANRVVKLKDWLKK